MKASVETKTVEGHAVAAESKKLKRELTLLPLFGLIYFTVCGGSFGAEPMVSLSGPGLTILLFVITPLVFSIPNMLMVREMQSMMPVEGGYYYWIKQAFGPFFGFLAGWMNWVVSWVDVSIYPVWAAYYLGYFIPVLRNGATINGVEVPGWVLSWLVALVLIWSVSALNVRGARIAGMFTNWLGAIMLIPLILMSIVGIAAWIKSGTTVHLPFLASGEAVSFKTLIPALGTGIYVAMWNFMGWELPTAAGDEVVNPKRTYPLAMALVLVAAIASYSIPTIAGLYGGAGEEGKYQLWGLEASDEEVGIVGDLAGEDASQGQLDEAAAQLETWGVEPASSVGWEFPDIAHVVADKLTGQTNGTFARVLGALVSFAAVLGMIGLFIGNGLGGTRIPFALAQDGMMPKFMVKVHPQYGTPWVAILFCGLIFSIFSLQAFESLVVIDVFLNMLVLLGCFFAMWTMRFKDPDRPREKVPGGWFGLGLITFVLTSVVVMAIVFNYLDSGMETISWSLYAMALGAALFPLILYYYKLNRGIVPSDSKKTGTLLATWLPLPVTVLAMSLALYAASKLEQQAAELAFLGFVIVVIALLAWSLTALKRINKQEYFQVPDVDPFVASEEEA